APLMKDLYEERLSILKQVMEEKLSSTNVRRASARKAEGLDLFSGQTIQFRMRL
ncbi:hypothetical protein L9F63_028299, partial [Diploptera punctata]